MTGWNNSLLSSHDCDIKIKIGSISIKDVLYSAYYLGGSRFVLCRQPDGMIMGLLDHTKIPAYIESGKLTLCIDSAQYEWIMLGIRTDGTTETHEADGTPK